MSTRHDVPVDGGELAVVEHGPADGPVALLVHGITASSAAWDAVVRRLPGHRLLVPDLRGRGRSNAVTGPAGMRRHAADLVAVLDALGVGRTVVAGHSMGGFVALALAQAAPDRVERLVLVDGGLPFTRPEGVSVDDAVAAVLGPALARLSMTFPTREAYHDFFRAHPALGPVWGPDVEAYVDHDLEPAPDGGWRSAVRADPVRDDSRDLHDTAAVVARLEGLTAPATFLRAPRGLMAEPGGLYPEGVLETWCQRVPLLTGRTLDDVDHYTILLSQNGSAAVAEAVSG